MSNAQKPNKHLRTKSIKKTGRAGKRAKAKGRLRHGKGKNVLLRKSSSNKRRK